MCINQTDLQERSNQVQLMSSIYSQAAVVLAWIGPGNDGLPGMEIINAIAPVIKAHADPSCWERADDMQEECRRLALEGFKWSQSQSFDLSKMDFIKTLTDFFHSEYWDRS
jgi:hypothetical protein